MSTNSQEESPQGEDVLPHAGVVCEEKETNSQAFTAPLLKPPPLKSQRKGRSNYIHDETMALLDILERRLPIGPEEWDVVSDEHALNFPKRSVDSIRRKFAGLHRRQPGTGNPNCPPEVEQAKRIKHLIGARANIGTQDEEFDLASQSFFLPMLTKKFNELTHHQIVQTHQHHQFQRQSLFLLHNQWHMLEVKVQRFQHQSLFLLHNQWHTIEVRVQL